MRVRDRRVRVARAGVTGEVAGDEPHERAAVVGRQQHEVVAGDRLVARRRELQRRRAGSPRAARRATAHRRAARARSGTSSCRMPAARGHPLRVALADDAATAVGVVVRDLAVEHVGDGLEPAVRVPRRALRLVGAVLDRPELVEEEEGVGRRAASRPPGNGRHTSKPAPSMAWCAGTVRSAGRATVVVGVGAGDRGSTSGFSTVTAGMAASGRSQAIDALPQPSCARNYSGDGAQPRVTGRRRGRGGRGGRSTPGSSVASSSPGSARTSVPSAMRPSSRASAAPRQWWMPEPNARCWAAPGAGEVERLRRRRPTWPGRGSRRRGTVNTNTPALDGARRRPRASTVVTRRENCTGRVVAQQLVDRVGVERRVVAPALELGAVAQQRERAVADEVDGRLVAGDVQQDHLVEQLVGRQPVAVVLGGDERR